MKNNTSILLLSVLVTALVACTKNEGRNEIELSPFDIRLEYTDVEVATEIAGEEVTKQSVSSVKYETLWDASDAAALYNATKGVLTRYVVKSGAGTKYAVFTPDGANPSLDASDELYVIYPYEAASLEGGKLYLSIYRDPVEDSYALSANKVFSRNDLLMSERFTPAILNKYRVNTRNITFRRLVALLVLTTTVAHDDLYSEPIEKVRLKCKGVAGKSAVTLTDGVPSLATNGGSEDECAFLTPSAPKMCSKDFLGRFIPVFPVNMSQDPNGGFSFVLVGSEHEAGFHRALNYTMAGNATANYFLTNILFGVTPVADESAATTDFSWWYKIKPDPLVEMALSGSSVSFPEKTFEWAPGDKVAVYSYKDSETTPASMDICDLNSGVGTASGTFAPENLSYGNNWVKAGSASDVYTFYSWYPANALLTGSSEIVASVAGSQSEGHLNEYLIGWAQGSETKTRSQVVSGTAPSFSYSPRMALVDVALHNSDSETLTVTGLHIETSSGYIAGDATLDVKNGTISGGTSSGIDYIPAEPIVIPAGVTSAVHTIAILPNAGTLTITAGNSITITSNTVSSPAAGQVYSVTADITGLLPVAPLDLEGNGLYYGEANCFMMSGNSADTKTFDVSVYDEGTHHARGSYSTRYRSAAKSAAVIWAENSLALIPTLNQNGNRCTMTVQKTNAVSGNALIGLYDGENGTGNLLWSFHIWCAASAGDVTSGDYTAMAFSLGQLTSNTDTYLYYQWGRKDPLGRASDFAHTSPSLTTTPTLLYTSKESGPTSRAEARRNPTVFYYNDTDPKDWVSSQDSYLWRESYKTIYDPCPKGYRVAPKGLWSGMKINNSGGSTATRTYNNLTYPAGGYRYSKNANCLYVGVRGHWWSSSVSDNKSVALYFEDDTCSPEYSSSRAYGYGVRCIKEE